jgi:hypothetical protein
MIIGKDFLDEQIVVRMKGKLTVFPIADAENKFQELLTVLSANEKNEVQPKRIDSVEKSNETKEPCGVKTENRRVENWCR